MSVWRSCPASWLGHRGPVLFLDRDGVVIVDRDYLDDPGQVQILPGADQEAVPENPDAANGVAPASIPFTARVDLSGPGAGLPGLKEWRSEWPLRRRPS